MPIVLNSNSAAIEASFILGKANNNLHPSIARLSSGNRITRLADDVGGLNLACVSYSPILSVRSEYE